MNKRTIQYVKVVDFTTDNGELIQKCVVAIPPEERVDTETIAGFPPIVYEFPFDQRHSALRFAGRDALVEFTTKFKQKAGQLQEYTAIKTLREVA